MRKFGLIGFPLSHSFSKHYFTKKFETEGLDAEYCNFPIKSLDQLEDILRSEPDLVGLNVTIPYKTAIIPMLNELTNCAASIQSVNTISIQRIGNSWSLKGSNTDVIGCKESIESHVKGHDKAPPPASPSAPRSSTPRSLVAHSQGTWSGNARGTATAGSTR